MLKELLKEIREQIDSQNWDKGVQLARGLSVTEEQVAPGEIVLLVHDKPKDVGYRVELYPEDFDWQCQCQGDDPCCHVAAGVIALSSAQKRKVQLPSLKAAGGGFVQYEFEEKSQLLHLQRGVQNGEEWTPFSGSLRKNQGLCKFVADNCDWACDQILPPPWHGVFERLDLKRLFKVLSQSERITFRGKKIRVLAKSPLYEAFVQDDGDGVSLEGRFRPRVLEIFKNGACLTEDGLAIYKAPDTGELWIRALAKKRRYGKRELSHFQSEVLPKVKMVAPLKLEAKNLLEEADATVFMELSCQKIGDFLQVTPRIVYGDPKIAALVDGTLRLEPLATSIPKRRLKKEEVLKEVLLKRLKIPFDSTTELSGSLASSLIEKAKSQRDFFVFDGDGHKDFEVHGELSLQVSFDEGSLSVSFFTGSFEKKAAKVSMDAFFSAFQRKEDTLALLDGGYAQLPKDWLKKYGAKIMDLMASQKESEDNKVPKASWPLAASLLEDLGIEPPKELRKIKQRLASLQKEHKPFQLPEDFKAKLRPYQKEGVFHLGTLKKAGLGALLADDMGLGKTVQTVALLDGLSLVVAPTSVLKNWQEEIEKFRLGLSVYLYYGRARDKSAFWRKQGENKVVLTSYAILRIDRDILKDVCFDNIVLDEAHSIKNSKSQVAEAAYSLQGDFRLALTGTPIENRLLDLYSQFRFLNSGFLGSEAYFRKRYVGPIANGDMASAKALKKKLAPFVVRRKKEDVLFDLPKKTETNLYVELSKEERELYDSLYLATKKEVVERLQGGKMMDALAALLRLRQAACHSALVKEAHNVGSSKMDLLLERLSLLVAQGHKALVFSQWTKFLDLMEPCLRQRGLSFLRLDGATKNRAELVERFQKEDSAKIFIMSLKAGGVGLNLTAADHVFITDPWWNPASEKQAADRAHRIGQKKPVMIYRMLSRDTIEESMERLKKAKEDLADNLIADGALGPTLKDLISLF